MKQAKDKAKQKQKNKQKIKDSWALPFWVPRRKTATHFLSG